MDVPEEMSARPDAIEQIHRSFFDVGCDVVETNTFGGMKHVLAEFGLADRCYELSLKAAQVARRAAVAHATPRQPRFAAGSLGPGTRLVTLRQISYDEMLELILVEVRAGRRVCGVFYGHPGVFARMPHRAVARARAEGFSAHMEPGISAEDCLYADLGIDPGEFGCQHFEASQLLFYRRRIDPSAYLVLWQIAVAGDRTHRRYSIGAAHRALLVERLAEDYPHDHRVTIYEAATLAIQTPRMDVVALRDLPDAELRLQSTLVVPPAQPLLADDPMISRAATLDSLDPAPVA